MRRSEYQIAITPADNGCLVRVGCKSLVFTKQMYDTMLRDIKQFLNKGEEDLRKKYYPEDYILDSSELGDELGPCAAQTACTGQTNF